MSTFILIHGAGDVGWSWHLVARELTGRGHTVIAPDLPGDDETLTFDDCADAVVAALGEQSDVIVVGHSMGAYTAPIIAGRVNARVLVLLAGMIPAPGESPDDWWAGTDCGRAVAEAARRDGGLTGNPDPYVSFYHDVPHELATRALSFERAHPSATAMAEPWTMAAWPRIPTRFIVCTNDRFFPPEFLRALALERLNVVADDLAASHCAPLSRPVELADMLARYAAV